MGLIRKLYLAGCSVLGLFLPVKKNKVVFSSYYGRGFSDNPKAIAEALHEACPEAKLFWLVKNEKEAASLPDYITPVPYDSPKRIFALSEARVWVDNCRKYERFKKKGQYYLQTWHGFPLKKIEKDAVASLPADYERGARRDSGFTDLLLSNSAFETRVLRDCFWYEGEIAEFGSPRNDVFAAPDPAVERKVRTAFGLPEDRRLVLYAPTFRADHSVEAYRLDAAGLSETLEKRFGGTWTVLIRLHPNVAHQSAALFSYDGERIADATLYPDMQELLVGSDVLITDYSSSMFDFAISGKLCLRLALDLEDYMRDRNFYFSYDEIPFPYAETNGDFLRMVEALDVKDYEEKRNEFYTRLAFCEDGKASERAAAWIAERLG
ncbi:MAG: CDP-glycerol glycerophosphotransferase family protein [Clostridia bacterium]|nr:CDP-glycerol glycerophosphotransferase family protein [Clostridia bacterium]